MATWTKWKPWSKLRPGLAFVRLFSWWVFLSLIHVLLNKGWITNLYSIIEKDRMVSRTRPLALWDERIFTHNQFEELRMPTDSWGRSSRFSQEIEKITDQESGYYRCASSFLEHPTSKDSTSASLILQQFMDTNWKGNKKESLVHAGLSNYDNTFEQSNDQMARSIWRLTHATPTCEKNGYSSDLAWIVNKYDNMYKFFWLY